ncbi:CMP/dCMP deaminase, zinc-binding protein [Desulfosarcina cetonica]|nr:CMP/dCMP deaminase, zinc-binding protein [Desulfosarcina cetonica]
MRFPLVEVALPAWIDAVVSDPAAVYPDLDAQMAFAIELARRNVAAGTGGPFGAAIFDMHTGRLVAPGVNRVMAANCSVAHAEITAIMIAQKILGTWDLGGEGLAPLRLVTSTEPCAMCLGAVVWSGVRQLVCGARDADARRIGFDEGPKPAEWVAALESRGIAVIQDVQRQDAAAVLALYLDQGGTVYNARQAEWPGG